jgi:hypothetical protein
MNRLTIVGICGEAFSGKDTAAKHLVNHCGFFRVALADTIRSSFNGMDGPTWDLRKELDAANKKARWPLQIIGNDCREDNGSAEPWIEISKIEMIYLFNYHPVPRFKFVVPDIRRQTEHDMLSEFASEWGGDFTSVKLIRPDVKLDGELAEHSSEKSVADVVCHHEIHNDKGKPELFGKIDWLIHERFEQQEAPKTELVLA